MSRRSHHLCEWVFTYVKGHMAVNWTASQYNDPASGERRAWLHVNVMHVSSAKRVRQKAVTVRTALGARTQRHGQMTNASKKKLLQDIDTLLPSARARGKSLQSHDHFWDM